MVREREREFRDFNKLEKEGLRVYEKEKASKPSRRGVIKEIRNIQSQGESTTASTAFPRFGTRGTQNRQKQPLSIATSHEEFSEKKVNIFDKVDSSKLNK